MEIIVSDSNNKGIKWEKTTSINILEEQHIYGLP